MKNTEKKTNEEPKIEKPAVENLSEGELDNVAGGKANITPPVKSGRAVRIGGVNN